MKIKEKEKEKKEEKMENKRGLNEEKEKRMKKRKRKGRRKKDLIKGTDGDTFVYRIYREIIENAFLSKQKIVKSNL